MERNRSTPRWPIGRLHLVPLLALIVLIGGTVFLALYTRAVVKGEEHRILTERANEVELVLATSVNTISTNMATLARVEERSGPTNFEEEAAAQVQTSTSPVGMALLRPGRGGFVVVVAAGTGMKAGQTVAGEPAAAMRAALRANKLAATDLYLSGGARTIGFALPTSDGMVVYRQSVLGPLRPPSAASTSAFSELRVVLYGSTTPRPDQALLSTTKTLPLHGSVRYVPLEVGVTSWLVAVNAVHPLTGSLAANSQWVALGVGLVGSALIYFLMEIMASTRDAALAAFETEHRFAETLQRRLLPAVPELAGLEIATNYVAGADQQKVGGDWFDVFPLEAGRVGIAIGDVMGHDVEAAATMSQLRASLRSYAVENPDPAWTIARLARFVDLFSIQSVVTVVYGVLDPAEADGSRRFRWANAGHLPPLLRRPDGTVEELALAASPLLGAPSAHPRPLGDQVLPAGSVLLLYTDGLVEMQGNDLGTSIRALRRVLEEADQIDAAAVCGAVLASHQPGAQRDDIALLAIRVDHPDRAAADPVQLEYGLGGSPLS